MNKSIFRKYKLLIMKNIIFKYSLFILSFSLVSSLFSACNESFDPGEDVQVKNSTVLIYAVATNSLRYNFVSDTLEMTIGGDYIDLDNNNVILYATTYENDAQLLKLQKDKNGKCHFNVIKDFSADLSSLNPARISEVIDLVSIKYPAKTNGIIFWSHSTASQPFTNLTSSQILDLSYSFGEDNNQSSGETMKINVNTLAESLPDHFFDFIWFDSCYMSNIETIYEFREKCDYFIGYPTEVVAEGIPYDRLLPYLTRLNPDILGAAETFYDYYTNYARYKIGTIAVIDMSKIEDFAQFCSRYYNKTNKPSTSSLFAYTTKNTGPFYDLGDYTKAMAELEGMELTTEEWEQALSSLVLYKRATTRDFNGNLIPQERYSGISTHLYDMSNVSATEQFYRSLSWFETTF